MTDKKFWDDTIAGMDRDKMESLQLKRLKDTLRHCYNNNDFYKKRLDDAGLDPDSVEDLSELEKVIQEARGETRDAQPEWHAAGIGLLCKVRNLYTQVPRPATRR